MLIKNFLKIFNTDTGKFLFLIGVFFLPTALPIAGVFLIFALILSFQKNKFLYLKEKINLSILIAIGLIFFSTINNLIYQVPKEIENLSNSLLWLNLFNWIPTLICFIGFQSYLKTKNDRLEFSKYFFAGTIPVIASCLFQLFFDINGPFEILNGLIVWFQKPLNDTGGISGLFSNRNYAGFWLSVSLPFTLYFFKKIFSCKIKSIWGILIILLNIYLIISTNSRNAFLSMISTLIIFFGVKSILLVLILILLLLLFNPILSIINIKITSFLPIIFERFGNMFFINSPRIIIFRTAINFILQRPFFGWGAGVFFLIYTNKENMWNPPFIYFEPQHTHNLLFEIAFNFGIPTAILITSIAIIIFIKAIPFAFSSKYNKETENYNLDKTWLCASLVVLIMHINDMTFYDGKISLLISILFSGLKCVPISKENILVSYSKNSKSL